MAGCLHLFETASAYTEARQNEYDEPWVSLTLETSGVNYNKTEREKSLETPLTFEITSPGKILWTADAHESAYTKTIEYKKNDGEWTAITSDCYDEIVTGITTNIGNFQEDGYDSGYWGQKRWSNQNGSVYGDVYDDTTEVYCYVTSVDINTSSVTTTCGSYTCDRYDETSGYYIWTGSNGSVRGGEPEYISVYSSFYVDIISKQKQIITPPEIDVVSGDVVQFRGNNASYCDENYSYSSKFSSSGCTFDVSGNIMSLINSNNFFELFSIETFGAFYGLFSGCAGLTNANGLVLPATTLAQSCYYDMFRGCTSLSAPPELPTTTLVTYCYGEMFHGCTSLTTAPELPATTLAQGCYYRMFGGCTSLTTAPELPVMTLANYCYQGMFNGCTSLVNAPELPATALATACYEGMFGGCTSLTTAPELPATTLVDSCYHTMFQYASNLNYIKCSAVNLNARNCLNSWVAGVSSTGTFVNPNLSADTQWTIGGSGIPTNWVIENLPVDYLTFYVLEDGEIGYVTGHTAYTDTIEYSKDGGETWFTIASSANTTIQVSSGDSVCFAGNLSTSCRYPERATYFTTTCRCNVSGNPLSLYYKNNHVFIRAINYVYTFAFKFKNCKIVNANNLRLRLQTLTQGCYYGMFSGCNLLVTAPELPAIGLASSCCNGMFSGCTSLTTAPALPATTLVDYCYQEMFAGCTSLTTAPELPAQSLKYYCYRYMFSGCTSLISGPSSIGSASTSSASACCQSMFRDCTSLINAPSLPAKTLPKYCYSGMFAGCTSLTTAPELPATALTEACYNAMFSGCTSLTTAPALPATAVSVNCYASMFRDCISLTTAPELPATSLVIQSYQDMFRGCSNLNYIKCLATNISAIYSHTNWVDGVASSGTFVKAASMTSWPTGVDGIPDNWTVQDA